MKVNNNIKFPFWYMNIKYDSKIIPDGKKHDIQLSGANCQVYAYEILRFNGLFIPDLRSSELWDYQNNSRIISCDYEALDILFFNETNDSWGAHLGVYIGENKVLHNSKDIGKPAIYDIGDFTKIKKYSCLLGGKRFKKL